MALKNRSLSSSVCEVAVLPAERRTVTVGLAVSTLALLLAYGVMPYARRWSERETLIVARAGQLARMREAVADSAATRIAFRMARALLRPWAMTHTPLIPSSGAPPYSR